MIEKVKLIASELGLIPSSEGGATLSCRMSEDAFRTLFGKVPVRLAKSPVSKSDSGRPPGYGAMDLPVHEKLRDFVECVSVIPPAIRM